MHVVVTGGAGFVGSQLCQALRLRGDQVTCVDDLSTGQLHNLKDLLADRNFRFVHADVTQGLEVAGPVDAVAHLASAASPPDYHRLPLQTLAAGSHGTEFALKLADRWNARLVLASTSEVYGNPSVHPQVEDYWGNVNPVGPRSVYDEAKRFAEALAMAYHRTRNVNIGILRIFNTYGPHMRARDGRVVSSFIVQALNHMPLTIYGDGFQTRSFCYIDDLVRGITAMIDSDEVGPINLGNPEERTVRDLAELVLALTGTSSRIEHFDLPVDDPIRRQPDIGKAVNLLGWRPRIAIEEGLRETIQWFVSRPSEVEAAAAAIAGGQDQGSGIAAMPEPAQVPVGALNEPAEAGASVHA